MKFGQRRHHRMPYWSRQKSKYKRRLKRKFIPGYGRHRAFSYKQWKNRNYQRAYRYFTYPSFRSAMRAKWEGRNPYDMHGYGRRVNPQAYADYKRRKTISNWNIIWVSFLVTAVVYSFIGHFAKLTFFGVMAWLFWLKYKYWWKPIYEAHHPHTHTYQNSQSRAPMRITPQQRKSLQADLDDLKASVNSLKSESASVRANGNVSRASNASTSRKENQND